MGSLTQYQRSVVIGSLLGDGYLRKLPGRSDAFLEINHSINQKEYVDWKYEILRDLTRSGPRKRISNGNRIAYRFFTRQVHDLSKLHRMFYFNKSKRIPNIKLDPVILAVWFMDDGSYSRRSDIYLNTQQFTYADQLKLIRMLHALGLSSRLNKDKQYFRIRFLLKSIPKLMELIDKHIIPSMRYKLGL